MKFLAIIPALLAIVAAKQLQTDVNDPFDDLRPCIAQKCPQQYNKCLTTSGCEDKLRKCSDKCGLKVNQTCWTFCIGLPGAAANVAMCAVNQQCIQYEDRKQDKLVKLAIEAIETILEDTQ